MKKFLTILVAVLITASVFAQAPEKMSYQAVIRNSSDQLVTGQAVGMQISILQGSASGTAVYVETQTPTTNANGLVSLEIGTGTVVSGDFTAIDWSTGPYFIKTETDPTGGTNYTIIGTSQLLSVPYALHAKTAENIPSGSQVGDMLYWDGSTWLTVEGNVNEGATIQILNGVPTWTTNVGDNFVINVSTGKIWMDRNLGASSVADSSTDTNAYGYLYQWGRASDGHQYRNSDNYDGDANGLATTSTPNAGNAWDGKFITVNNSPYDWLSLQDDNLWQGVNGINNPCPSGYRLPTEAEWDAERQSWSSNDAAGAYDSPLKLTLAGHRTRESGSLAYLNLRAHYWTSTVNAENAKDLFILDNNAYIASHSRAYGYSIRCIKN